MRILRGLGTIIWAANRIGAVVVWKRDTPGYGLRRSTAELGQDLAAAKRYRDKWRSAKPQHTTQRFPTLLGWRATMRLRMKAPNYMSPVGAA